MHLHQEPVNELSILFQIFKQVQNSFLEHDCRCYNIMEIDA